MVASSRVAVTYGLGLVVGAALFFLAFAAVFNGAGPFLVLFVLCYAAAGALGVRAGGAAPVPLATTLALPAVPWVLWLFPASVTEAGLLRALLWPALVSITWASAWLGGRIAGARRLREPPCRGTDVPAL